MGTVFIILHWLLDSEAVAFGLFLGVIGAAAVTYGSFMNRKDEGLEMPSADDFESIAGVAMTTTAATPRALPLARRSQSTEGRLGVAHQGGCFVTNYLPAAYTRFRDDYPGVAAALDGLGAAADECGPLDGRTERLVKLGLAIGGSAEGAARSNVRKAIDAGASAEEIRQIGVLAITTVGFPAAIAALGWIDEVLTTR